MKKQLVRVHAVNKKVRSAGKGHEYPHALSQVFNKADKADAERLKKKIKEYEDLGGEKTEMLVEVVPLHENPSWVKKA